LQAEIDNKDMGEIPMWIYEFIEQAKTMEKEQMEDAYDAGLFDGTMDDVKDRIHSHYYNETHKRQDNE
jgi:hypothetical protein